MRATTSKLLPVAMAFTLSACLGESVITFEGELEDTTGAEDNFEYRIEGDVAIATPKDGTLLLAAGNRGPEVVYLNFEGVTMQRGGWRQDNAQTNTSFIVPNTVAIPAFDASPWAGSATRQQVIDFIANGVREDYGPYGVEFVTERPQSGAYTMIVIGGSSGLLGIGNGTLGVAPLDPTNFNASDVGFVFPQNLANFGYTARQVAHTISHELGHSVGLQHIIRNGDIMGAQACHCAQSWGSGPLLDNQSQVQNDLEILEQAFPLVAQVPETSGDAIGAVQLSPNNSEVIAHGFTCDPDVPQTSNRVQLWVGGPAGSNVPNGTFVANRVSDQAAADACGGGDAHGFAVRIPLSLCGQPVYTYSINVDGTPGGSALVDGAPVNMPACQ